MATKMKRQKTILGSRCAKCGKWVEANRWMMVARHEGGTTRHCIPCHTGVQAHEAETNEKVKVRARRSKVRRARKATVDRDPVVRFHKSVSQVASSPILGTGRAPVIYLIKDRVWVMPDPHCTTWARGSMAGIGKGEVVHALPTAGDDKLMGGIAEMVARQNFGWFVGNALMNSTVLQVVVIGPGKFRVRAYGMMRIGRWVTVPTPAPAQVQYCLA